MSRFRQIEEIFHHAADLHAGARQEFLDQACAADPSLRAEVESLLSEMHTDIAAPIAAAAALVELPETLPERLGSFRIIRLLGEGGMGRVYEAEQDSPRRSVALKVIRPGLMSRSVLRRFTHESNVLGQLKHPAIAQVYQAGTFPAPDASLNHGQPYFAMEIVRGASLAEYARARELSAREMLELIARICDGVQHAHQRGIIHRDLKPGNILIEGDGADAQPKILDFGIARLVDDSAASASRTVQTEAGQIVGTLAYMSPEQVDADPARIDTRSDVYALGVIAYELLAKRPPIDVSGKTIVEAARLIREHDPVRLGLIDRSLAGDIETIVAKAIDKDRERRYASASELASDIRRFLNHEPILARPSSAIYQITRFARRNRPLVAGAMIAAAAVLVGGALATWQAIVATRERNAALVSDRRSTALKDFLIKDVFGSASTRRRGPGIPAGELLALAGARIDERFAGDDELRIEAERLMFALQSDMGRSADAIPHARRMRDLSAQVYGKTDRRTARADLDLAEILLDAEKTDEVEPVIADLHDRLRNAYGPASPEALRSGTLAGLLRIQRSQVDEAQRILDETYAIHKGHAGRSYTGYYRLLAGLTHLAALKNDPEQHLRWAKELLEFSTSAFAPDSSALTGAQQAMSQALLANGRFAEAEPLMRQALENDRRMLMANDPDLLRSAGQYAMVLARMGRTDDAESLFKDVADKFAQRFGPGAWETTQNRKRLLTLYIRTGQDDKAIKWLTDEESLQRSLATGDTQGTLEPRRHLAQFLLMRDRVGEAKTILDDLVPRAQKAIPDRSAGETKHFLGALDITLGMLERRLAGDDKTKRERARTLLNRGLEVHAAEWSSSFPDMAKVAQHELKALDDTEPLNPQR